MTGLKLNQKALASHMNDLFGGSDGLRLQFVRAADGKGHALDVTLRHVENMRFDRIG